MRIVKRVINEQQGTVYKLRQLERDGYQLLPATIPPEGKLIDSGIESLGTTKSAVQNDLQIKLAKMGIMMNDTKKGYPLFKEEPDKKVRFKWFMTENSAVKKPIDITSKISPLGKDVSYKPGYGKSNTGVPVFNFGEQTSNNDDIYSFILGFIAEYGDNMAKTNTLDTFKYLQAKKTVLWYCEDKRDKKSTKELSTSESKGMFNAISRIYNDLKSKHDPSVIKLIDRGKTFKSNRFG